MRIGLILDNPRRDLRGIALLTYQLLKHGHVVFVIPMYDQGYDGPLLNLDVIVVNYARTANLDFIRSYKEMGIAVVVLDTEGGILPERGTGSPEFWARRVCDIGAHDLIDRYLFWGRRAYEAFRQHGKLPEDRLIITGCPRYDFCHEKWRSVLHYPKSGYILFNLNFPSINPWWGQAEFSEAEGKIVFHSAIEETMQASKVLGVDVEQMLPHVRERQRTLGEYVRVIAEVAHRNPEQAFIVRPHPFEGMQLYHRLFSGLNNVTVDPSGEVMDVISQAEFVIHLNCSTSVETRLLGKSPVSLEFLNSDLLRLNVYLPSRVSYAVSSLEELDKIVKDRTWTLQDHLTESSRHELIEPWFYKCDGRAAERVADIVSDLVQKKDGLRCRRSYWNSVKSSRGKVRMKNVIQGIASQILGSYALVRLRILLHKLLHKQSGLKYIRAERLSQHIQELAGCEKLNLDFSVQYAVHPLTSLRLATIQVKRTSENP